MALCHPAHATVQAQAAILPYDSFADLGGTGQVLQVTLDLTAAPAWVLQVTGTTQIDYAVSATELEADLYLDARLADVLARSDDQCVAYVDTSLTAGKASSLTLACVLATSGGTAVYPGCAPVAPVARGVHTLTMHVYTYAEVSVEGYIALNVVATPVVAQR